MKVLFAVSNESISEGIVKQYQREYKEILSYKNVYYFNAILKEIQRDKTYDRIVISEELEPFASNNYETIDKFLFEKLDNISDEAQDSNGQETSIIFICTDRRTKGSSFLVKLFSIGIYNALLGNDRIKSEVCRLINKPRIKKEAKAYYKIDAEDAKYDQSNEKEVSELEIQNILSHFKKLGKNTDKYTDSFNNIAMQYTDEQLKIIINCLPIGVKAVLESESEKYQEMMSVSGGSIKGVKNMIKTQEVKPGIRTNFIDTASNRIDKPIIIPSSVKKVNVNNKNNINTAPATQIKVPKNIENDDDDIIDEDDFLDFNNTVVKPTRPVANQVQSNNVATAQNPRRVVTQTSRPTAINRPDRPVTNKVQPIESNKIVNNTLNSSVKPVENKKVEKVEEDNLLPGFDEEDVIIPGNDMFTEDDALLPGFDIEETDDDVKIPGIELEEDDDLSLPGFEDEEDLEEEIEMPGTELEEDDLSLPGFGDDEELEDEIEMPTTGLEADDDLSLPGFGDDEELEDEKIENEEVVEKDDSEDLVQEVTEKKRGRGRPRKTPIDMEPKPKGKRGRPRKVQIGEEILPGLEDEKIENTLPGLEDDDSNLLPGFEDDDAIENDDLDNEELDDEIMMPGNNIEDDDSVVLELEDDEEFELPGNELEEDDDLSLPGFEDTEDFDNEMVEMPGNELEEDDDLSLPGFDDEEDFDNEMVEMPENELEEDDDLSLPGFDDEEDFDNEMVEMPENELEEDDDLSLPGFDDEEDFDSEVVEMPENELEEDDLSLPGFDDAEESDDDIIYEDELEDDDSLLPGFDDAEESNEEVIYEDELEDDDSLLAGFDDAEESDDDIIYEEELDDDEVISDDLEEIPALSNSKVEKSENEIEEYTDEVILPDLDDLDDFDEEEILPGMDIESIDDENEEIIPGLEYNNDFQDNVLLDDEEESILPGMGFEDNSVIEEDNLNSNYIDPNESLDNNFNNNYANNMNSNFNNNAIESVQSKVDYSMSSLNSLLTKEKKIVSFVGTTKNGTSFLINHLGLLFSSLGINTAILDMTKNKNSYYIYTKNEENLRKIAYTSISKLQNGYVEGIKANKNLTVYTALPNDGKDYSNAEPILSTLVQNYSLVLIDCDFETSPSYFASCQEIYLVQSMDILTIQPLTAFLKELKVKGVLEPEKIRVAINKEIKVRGLTSKLIITGMSSYNDPSMSFMTELFNKDIVKACSIPFDENSCSKYMEDIAKGVDLSLNGYSKPFISRLKVLGDMVYPLTSKQTYGKKTGPVNQDYSANAFSSSMNNTLNQMRKKY